MRTLRFFVLAAPTLLLGALAATHAGRAHALVNGRAIDAEGSGFVHLHGAMSTCTGTFIAWSTLASAILSEYDMSVCQPWPASPSPTALPSRVSFDRIITSG